MLKDYIVKKRSKEQPVKISSRATLCLYPLNYSINIFIYECKQGKKSIKTEQCKFKLQGRNQ